MTTPNDPIPSNAMSDQRTPGLSPDDAMPPVKAPTAGFLIQLFVVPAVIVSVIIAVWLTVTWLVQDHHDPRRLLMQLRHNQLGQDDQRYHAAYKLANILRSSQYETLKRDSDFAAELASILNEQIDQAKPGNRAMQEGPVLLRVYIASALAQFHVNDGLDVLIKAAATERDPAEVEVRLGSLQAIAMLTENVRTPLTKNMLPDAAKRCEQIALQIEAGPDSSAKQAQLKLATQFRELASEASRLARDMRRPGDLAQRTAALANSLSALAADLKRSPFAASGASDLEYIQQLAKEMTAQAKQLDLLQWHPDSELARMLLRAADERHIKTRPHPQTKRDVGYDHLIRLGAAYCLGLIGGAEPIAKLEQMLEDGNSEVRYNATVSLCRHGGASPSVVRLLIEMISDPQVAIVEPVNKISADDREKRMDVTRQRVMISALHAIEVLLKENPTDGFIPLQTAVQRLLDKKPSAAVHSQASSVLRAFKKRTP